MNRILDPLLEKKIAPLGAKVQEATRFAESSTGEVPDTIYIHPDKLKELGVESLEEICGLKVRSPSPYELEMVAMLMGGRSYRDPGFWDKEQVYIFKDHMTSLTPTIKED